MGIVAKTAMVWQGVLRSGILMFFYGFIFFAAGFLWNIAITWGFWPLPSSDIAFFAIGVALSLLGANKVFALTSFK